MRNAYDAEELAADVLTRREAARILECSPDTVSRMCRDGRLTAYKVGTGTRRTHWRILAADLLAYARMLAE